MSLQRGICWSSHTKNPVINLLVKSTFDVLEDEDCCKKSSDETKCKDWDGSNPWTDDFCDKEFIVYLNFLLLVGINY